jgi:hypothetical protein
VRAGLQLGRTALSSATGEVGALPYGLAPGGPEPVGPGFGRLPLRTPAPTCTLALSARIRSAPLRARSVHGRRTHLPCNLS